MNSNCIYIPKTDRVPYFYIIQHILSGKFYAGSKRSIGCSPITFMKSNGYCTSSNVVKSIIKEDGLDAFRIHTIMTESDCGIDVYAYETRFLRDNNIAQRDNWFNYHNNTVLAPFGSEEFEIMMLKKTGFRFSSQCPESREKAEQTRFERTGYRHALQNPECRDQARETYKERTGYDYSRQNPEVLIKARETYKERTRYDHNMQNPEVLIQMKIDCLERTGYEHHMQDPIFLAEYKANNLERTGYENTFQDPETKAKIKNTLLVTT